MIWELGDRLNSLSPFNRCQGSKRRNCMCNDYDSKLSKTLDNMEAQTRPSLKLILLMELVGFMHLAYCAGGCQPAYKSVQCMLENQVKNMWSW
jgi:hypothetical protein